MATRETLAPTENGSFTAKNIALIIFNLPPDTGTGSKKNLYVNGVQIRTSKSSEKVYGECLCSKGDIISWDTNKSLAVNIDMLYFN